MRTCQVCYGYGVISTLVGEIPATEPCPNPNCVKGKIYETPEAIDGTVDKLVRGFVDGFRSDPNE